LQHPHESQSRATSGFLYAFKELADCALSFFYDDSNLLISTLKYVLTTAGGSKESISKFLIGNWFHVKLPMRNPYSNIYFSYDL